MIPCCELLPRVSHIRSQGLSERLSLPYQVRLPRDVVNMRSQSLQSAVCTSTTTPKLSVPTLFSTFPPLTCRGRATFAATHTSRVCRPPHFDQRPEEFALHS